MTERRLDNLSWESFAERKIRESQEQGAFAHLSVLGRPIRDIDRPAD